MSQTLELSRSLYDPDAVAEAVAAFQNLATIEVEATEARLRVTITDPDPDVADVLADELCNHALAHTVARHRAL